MKYFTVKELAFLALLAAVNSVIEITLGSIMHALKIPGKSVVLVTINMMIYFTAYSSVQKKGAIVLTGFITAFIKIAYGWGGSKLAPAAAIFLEAAIIEACFSVMPLKNWSSAISGALVKLFSFFFPILSYLVFGIEKGFANITATISAINANLPFLSFPIIIASFIIWNIILGALLGLLAYRTSNIALKIFTACKKTT